MVVVVCGVSYVPVEDAVQWSVLGSHTVHCSCNDRIVLLLQTGLPTYCGVMKKWTTSHTGNMLQHGHLPYMPVLPAKVFILIIESLFPSKEISNFLFLQICTFGNDFCGFDICLCFLWEVTITGLINTDNSHWYIDCEMNRNIPRNPQCSPLPTPIFTSLWQTRADVTFAEFLFLQFSFIEWGTLSFPSDRS